MIKREPVFVVLKITKKKYDRKFKGNKRVGFLCSTLDLGNGFSIFSSTEIYEAKFNSNAHTTKVVKRPFI